MEEQKKKLVKEKEPKQRKEKYDEKLSFDGSFDDLLDLTVIPKKENKTKNP